jgi:hypothetical protein
MDMHIPWTPRTVWRTDPDEVPDKKTRPADALCERTIAILHPIIWKALKPFVEARKALSAALREAAIERGEISPELEEVKLQNKLPAWPEQLTLAFP